MYTASVELLVVAAKVATAVVKATTADITANMAFESITAFKACIAVSPDFIIFTSSFIPVYNDLIRPRIDKEALKATIPATAAPMASLYFHTKEMIFLRASAPLFIMPPSSLAIFFSSPL